MTIQIDIEKTPAQLFSRELVRIKYIQHIQNDLRAAGVSKVEMKIHFLNQAYIFQLIAFWQVFIQELAAFGFRKMAEQGSHTTFQDVARKHLEERLEKFNTPKRTNIDKLFNDGLAIPDISKSWQSPTLSFDKACSTLAGVLSARHEIAHAGRTEKALSYQTNFEDMEVLMQIAELSEAAVLRAVEGRAPKTP